jgi:translation elongation factor EF-G
LIKQWLPIPTTVFSALIDKLPNPIRGYQLKSDIIFPCHNLRIEEANVIKQFKKYAEHLIKGETIDVPNIAFVSKMVPIEKKNIGGEEYKNIEISKDDIVYMPFSRNFVGTIKKGREYYVIGPKHDPKNNVYDIKKFKFENLYFFMGQYLEPVDEVPPGNIFSVSGLDNFIFKTATIASVFESPNVHSSNFNVKLFLI